MGLTISWNLSVNFYANPLASPCDAIWSSSPSTLRCRYEIVPRTEKMSACQTLKACNLLGMFLLVCVTVVREPHAQAGSHTSVFSLSSSLLFLYRSLFYTSTTTCLLFLFSPCTAIYFFNAHACACARESTRTHSHTHTIGHTMLVLEMVSAQWLLHWGLNVLSYIGWSLPPGQKAI